MSTQKTARPAAPLFATPECDEPPTCARDRIFEAARDLFYKHGIRGVSVDTIAAEAGTTKVTLYRVFASKDDLVLQVLEDHDKRFWQCWEEVVERLAGKPREQIEALFELLIEQIGTCGQRGCPIANAAVEIVDEDHPARRVIRAHHAEIARRFRTLCREMGARRPDQLGDALTLLVEGVFATRIVCEGTAQIEVVREAARALLDSPDLGVAQGKPPARGRSRRR